MRTSLKLAICLALGVAQATAADVRLPNVFGDHMVLQQDAPIRVFGWAEPGERVVVELNRKRAQTEGDADGRFRVQLPAMMADGESHTLSIKGNNTIELTDVLLGEVWICSGQSNMEWALRSTLNAEQEVEAANHPTIRLFNVPGHISSPTPNDNTPGQWQACTSQTSPQFSAVGYFFGRMLERELEVPIGLIGTNWGGTRIEPWTPPVGFDSVPELADFSTKLRQMDPATDDGKAYFKDYLAEVDAWQEAARSKVDAGQDIGNPPARMTHQRMAGATTIYNGMVHGLAPFSVRGAIWYQGESNGGEGESYFHKMTALINGWRSVFENDELAFHFVQLADFHEAKDDPAGGDGWAKLREAQRKTLTLSNTGMAVILDIGNARDIHPRNKQDVGARLARWALAQTYGWDDVVASGPLYHSHSVEGSRVRVTFDHVGSGLMVGLRKDGLKPTEEGSDGSLKRFAIAGADKTWHWAEARIDGDEVVVWSDEVPDPVAVRYGFSMNPAGANLYNKEGLPASGFRTDAW